MGKVPDFFDFWDGKPTTYSQAWDAWYESYSRYYSSPPDYDLQDRLDDIARYKRQVARSDRRFTLLLIIAIIIFFAFSNAYAGCSYGAKNPEQGCAENNGGHYSGNIRYLWGAPFYECTNGGGMWCSDEGECSNGWDASRGECNCDVGKIRNATTGECECPDLPDAEQTNSACRGKQKDDCPAGDFSGSEYDGLCSLDCVKAGEACIQTCKTESNVLEFSCDSAAGGVTKPCKCKVPNHCGDLTGGTAESCQCTDKERLQTMPNGLQVCVPLADAGGGDTGGGDTGGGGGGTGGGGTGGGGTGGGGTGGGGTGGGGTGGGGTGGGDTGGGGTGGGGTGGGGTGGGDTGGGGGNCVSYNDSDCKDAGGGTCDWTEFQNGQCSIGGGGGTGGGGTGGGGTGGGGTGGGGTGGGGTGGGGTGGGGTGDGTNNNASGEIQVKNDFPAEAYDAAEVDGLVKDIAGGVNKEIKRSNNDLKAKSDDLETKASSVFAKIFKPKINYVGGCDLGTVTFMGKTQMLSFCDYMDLLETLGNILFAFANITAFFVYVRVFTQA